MLILPGKGSRPHEGIEEAFAEGLAPVDCTDRPRAQGKFLSVGGQKLWIRGVTYGAFRPDEEGKEYQDLKRIHQDFAQMAANGLNAVRIPHTMPPRPLLDAAARHRLRVMVGLSAEQFVGYLIDGRDAPDIEGTIRAKVGECAGHPAVLCYAIGNEIPAPLVRWLGRRRVERYLRRLYRAIKAEDPEGLVTYVNYPTTEFLDLSFLDLLCFNVYLEQRDRFEAYLARLQNIAGDRPLVMTEIGLDSLRNGEAAQAEALDWQVRATFAAAAAGAFVFAWTDEWHRAGADVYDWAFGLTDRERRPKPALAAVRDAFAEAPFPKAMAWPRISVIVCTYNGAERIRDCLNGLLRLEYPDFEVIVVNDGSKDSTAATVREYGCRLITSPNRGLSRARNTGLEAATGEVVAYIDDDAWPDPHWLTYLAATFLRTSHAGVGGPNLPPPDGPIAEAVANAPGGPTHVLLGDELAEHIPGCNMAFRKACLEAIGGFDPQFRVAGDDVDVCWRIQERGWTLGFSPGAVVWHKRRGSVRTYWRQQREYGKAEARLERKWPDKYNAVGHLTWGGVVYSRGTARLLPLGRARIYQGIWGTAPFQFLEQRAPGLFWSLATTPEANLVLLALAGLSLLAGLWAPLVHALPVLAVCVGVRVIQAGLNAARAQGVGASRSRAGRLLRWGLIACLHLMQPLARLVGRVRGGLTLWRWRGPRGFAIPVAQAHAVWKESWQAPEERLRSLRVALQAEDILATCGGVYDRWDLEVRGGALAGARASMAVEDHGAGRQLVRVRTWARYSRGGCLMGAVLAALAAAAGMDGAWHASAVLGGLVGLVGCRALLESGRATAALLRAVRLTTGAR